MESRADGGYDTARDLKAGLERIDQRTFLLDVFAQHLAQGPVEQVRGRVVAHGVLPVAADFERRRLADLDRALADLADVQHRLAEPLRVFDRRRCRSAS